MKYIIFFLLIYSISPALRSQDMGEQQKKLVIDEHYKKALEAYSRKDYPSAVNHWSEIVRLDPEQQSAKDLLRKARLELADHNKKKEKEAGGHIVEGRYAKAKDIVQILSVSDPTNARYKELFSRLDEVAAVAPEVSKGSPGTVRLIRTAMKYFLSRQENPRLAITTLRYARQRDPKSKEVEGLLGVLEGRFPKEAQEEVPIEGLDLARQKLEVALTHIYDAKYTAAIQECNEVLILEPDNVDALKRMGSAYYKLKNKPKAREVWRRAQRLAPQDKELKAFLASQ
ncbi:MAG: tetratricopeptide repeat protein [Elusimicrobia bacterium]|nr:tetratricopeptide repeat protein [Elusimicrobiota bacterium]